VVPHASPESPPSVEASSGPASTKIGVNPLPAVPFALLPVPLLLPLLPVALPPPPLETALVPAAPTTALAPSFFDLPLQLAATKQNKATPQLPKTRARIARSINVLIRRRRRFVCFV
jgi:hypothetical protein